MTITDVSNLKYTPVVSVEAERSFSMYKSFFPWQSSQVHNWKFVKEVCDTLFLESKMNPCSKQTDNTTRSNYLL